MKIITKQNIKSIILALILVAGVGVVSAYSTWTSPTAPPPGNNVDTPINVGGGVTGNIYTQTKSGILNLAHLFTSDLNVTNSDGTVTNIPTGSVLTADGDNTGHVKWQAPTECQGSGLVWVIPNPQMNDNGSSGGDDSMEVYCRNGVTRWCLSGELCPWRSAIASDDSQVCSPSKLGTGSYYPGNSNLLLMTSAWGDLWQPYTVYYCSKDGTQKVGRYVSSIGNLSCGPDNTTQVINQPVVWSSLKSPTGGDNVNYTYQWNGTDHGSWLPSPATSQDSITYSYTTPGTKTMSMNVLSYGASRSLSCATTVTVTLPPIQGLSCSVSPTTGTVNSTSFVWSVGTDNLSGGSGTYSYKWNGTTDGTGWVSTGSTASRTLKYTSSGTKNMAVTVTSSSNGSTVTANVNCSNSVTL